MNATSALPRPSGPRCHCGTAITHTPGKRPRVYCSDRCRKAAKRAVAKIEREAANAGRPAKADALGKETTEFPAPLRPAETSAGAKADADPEAARERTSRERRARRYEGRRTLWRITGDSACKGCGRALMDPASGVLMAQTSSGAAVVLGLMRCARIWLCPVCAATIRHRRAEEITAGVTEWISRGGTAYLVTLTARHASTHRLADLMDAIQGTRADRARGITRRPGAYQRLITGGTWAGRRASDGHRAADREGIRDRVGYVGMIRATEITMGGHGWHPHIHAIVLVGGRTEGERADKRVVEVFDPSESALAELEDHYRSVWTRALRQIDPEYTPDRRHGVDFKRLHTAQDARDLGRYIAKTQDGKAPALELARADLKSAAIGSMTPFELLYRIGDLTGGVPEEDAPGHGTLAECLGRWHEYERAVKGRRAIEWSRHLRTLLGLDGGDTEDDDMDLLHDADADAGEWRGGVAVTEEGWHAVARRALDLAATQAAEGTDANTDPGAVLGRVQEVLALAGADATVRQLGPAEVADAYAAMLESLAQRREEAAARRRREHDQEHDQEHDADRARRALARRAVTAGRTA